MTTLYPPETTTPVDSIIELTRELVRTPSVTSDGDYEPVLLVLEEWLRLHGVMSERLTPYPGGHAVGLLVTVDSERPGPAVALDACLDTAEVGDARAWAHEPFGAEIVDGWMYGRGTADSKVAVATFAHLATELAASPPPAGKLLALFDVDEHSGRFGGARAFHQIAPPLAGMMIGYPGNHGVVAGARGFWRATITTWGTAAHSGATRGAPDNALSKAARLVVALEEAQLTPRGEHDFPFGPSLTVTEIEGGGGYSQVPDWCELKVDVRLTPSFTARDAATLVRSIVRRVDGEGRPSRIHVEDSWPAYRLPDAEPVVDALRRAARAQLGRKVPAVVCGPSNIGNFLHSHGVPATCGFGVTYRNIHAADEAIELASIGPVYRTYRDAVLDLLDAPEG